MSRNLNKTAMAQSKGNAFTRLDQLEVGYEELHMATQESEKKQSRLSAHHPEATSVERKFKNMKNKINA